MAFSGPARIITSEAGEHVQMRVGDLLARRLPAAEKTFTPSHRRLLRRRAAASSCATPSSQCVCRPQPFEGEAREMSGKLLVAIPFSSWRSVTVGRTKWEEWTIWPRLVHRPCKRGPCEQPSPIGMDIRERLADRVGPVGVEQRGCGSAVGEAEGVARRPPTPRHSAVEPAVGSIEQLPCFRDTMAVAML